MQLNYAMVFDLDGTLVNSLPDICGILNQVREEYGLKRMLDDHIQEFIGGGAEILITNTFSEVLSRTDWNTIIDRFREIYLENPSRGGHPYPGAVEVLQQLRQVPFLKLAIATNKYTSVAERTLAHYLPNIRFDAIFGPDKVSQKKPSARHLLETLEHLQVPPARAFFMGDDAVDHDCAKEAQVTFFGATYGFGGVEVQTGTPVRQISELLKVLPFMVEGGPNEGSTKGIPG